MLFGVGSGDKDAEVVDFSDQVTGLDWFFLVVGIIISSH